MANRSIYRCMGAAVVGMALLTSASGATAQPPSESPQLAAYRYAVRCFFANGHAASLYKRRGDAAMANKYWSSAERSHQGAVALGRRAGLSDAAMAQDFDAYRSPEPARFVSDADYFDRAVAACKTLGLM